MLVWIITIHKPENVLFPENLSEKGQNCFPLPSNALDIFYKANVNSVHINAFARCMLTRTYTLPRKGTSESFLRPWLLCRGKRMSRYRSTIANVAAGELGRKDENVDLDGVRRGEMKNDEEW